METRLEQFVSDLAMKRRVLLLGGLAVVRHGLPRYTKDADIWLEPLKSPNAWAEQLADSLTRFPEVTLMRLFPQQTILPNELGAAIAADRVIRITGFEMPLDVFREPNELEQVTFDEAYSAAADFQGNFKILSAVDLLNSKENTGREQDRLDIGYLEAKIRDEWKAKLPSCDAIVATRLLSRYMDHVVLEAALDNPDPAVQCIGRRHLREFAECGDPYAIDAWIRRFGPLK